MVGLLFLTVVSVALYWIWDPIRAEEAEEEQTEKAAERGAALFATFCRVCHGNQGLGRLEGTNLPGLPLNLPENRPSKPLDLERLQALFADTIRCGRVGTLMPPWHLAQGGPLNDEQIRQLVTLITSSQATVSDPENPFGETTRAWEQVLEEANHQDDTGKRLETDVLADDTVISVDDASALPREASDLIRLDNELVLILEVRGDDLVVERGQLGTKPIDHAAGSPVYEPPFDPPTGPINAEACGQFARGAATAPSPPGEVFRPDEQGNLAVEQGDDFFVQNQIEVGLGQTISITVANNGQNIHNMRIAGLDDEYDSGDDFVSDPALMRAGDTATLVFSIEQPGTFVFRCDFHPDVMVGTISVVER
ncbi:MAG: c-type cytochrome [Dehalococcoidia bacterium]